MRTLDEAAIATQAVQNELEVLRTTPFSLLQDGRASHRPAALEQLHLADTKVTVSAAPDGTIGLKKIEIDRWITENGRACGTLDYDAHRGQAS